MFQRVLVCTIGLALATAIPAVGQVRVQDGGPQITIDIMPERCPNRIDLVREYNPFSVTSARADGNGIPVAVIGSSELDVFSINPLSVLLEGVAPSSYRYKDVSSTGIPLEGECDCYVSGPDGIMDLVLEFDRFDLVAAIQPIEESEVREVELSLSTKSGLIMQASDCVMVSPTPTTRLISGITPETPAAAFNYPNPFNAGTVISYEVGTEGHVRLEVFDVLGRSVTTLVNETQSDGIYQQAWDGTDRNGTAVGSGMYFYRLTQNLNIQTQKMVLLK